MKKFIIGFIAVAAIAASVSSCKKYEDGPAISLRTKKARLSNEWVLDKYYINDADQTSNAQALFGANFVWEIEKDGKYTITGNYTETGTWELGEDKDDIRFRDNSSNSTEDSYRILRLKEKELWLRHTESNGDVVKMYLKGQ